ncbi:hypothetical protein [Massilia sp. ST3]|uniref:hypothetical protein n=1 Tax=Massilia sp. ST3 TaxID=2824903 RepID=UPI001B8384C5|nr:hypothetical protein [Massilia sp. ST3]MBQ5949896.1 hypothetical protein [Massilia sp. ST3]
MRLIALGALAFACHIQTAAAAGPSDTIALFDKERARPVPVALYFPASHPDCTPARPCPVALLSPGYGNSHLEYGFLSERLARLGYLVAAIGQEAPGDARLDPQGDMVRQRAEMARRGATTIRFVHGELAQKLRGYDWQRVVLAGHSMGGDSSALLASTDPAGIAAVVTLDNRRAALPRSSAIRVLSLRAADTGADPGVLPDAEERRRYQSCILDLAASRHNDMYDGGPPALKDAIGGAVERFLRLDAARRPAFACAQ